MRSSIHPPEPLLTTSLPVFLGEFMAASDGPLLVPPRGRFLAVLRVRLPVLPDGRFLAASDGLLPVLPDGWFLAALHGRRQDRSSRHVRSRRPQASSVGLAIQDRASHPSSRAPRRQVSGRVTIRCPI